MNFVHKLQTKAPWDQQISGASTAHNIQFGARSRTSTSLTYLCIKVNAPIYSNNYFILEGDSFAKPSKMVPTPTTPCLFRQDQADTGLLSTVSARSSFSLALNQRRPTNGSQAKWICYPFSSTWHFAFLGRGWEPHNRTVLNFPPHTIVYL